MSGITHWDIYTQVKAGLARGSAYDDVIPSYIKQAARWLERNYTFQYMETFREINVYADSTDPRIVTLPGPEIGQPALIKAIRFVRIAETGEDFKYLIKIDPQDVKQVDIAEPQGYWLSGASIIVLDSYPTADLVLEIGFNEYTSWPTLSISGGEAENSYTNWLIANGSDVLVAQTLYLMAVHTRNNELVSTYMQLRQEGLQTLLGADQELRMEGKDSYMRFS